MAGMRTGGWLIAALVAAGGLSVIPSPAAPDAAAATTIDPRGPEGLDLTRAFTLTEGAPTSVIGYVEGGVNWHDDSAARLAPRTAVNWRETPVPCPAASSPCPTRFPRRAGDDDANHDGAVTVADWAGDPRVKDANGNGLADPEDLIVAFSDGRDQDRNAFPDDISGWDFYTDQNDPATPDATYTHANDQMLNALDQCPKCLVLPVKAGDEALDATDKLAQAWLYAAQQRVSVITSVTADLGYSTFMRQAVDSIARRGIAMVASSNDFDSTDHQGGMFWPGVVPGNGALPDPGGTRFVRANETSWGTHAMLTVPGHGSTSASTSATGGLVGLLMAWGQREFAAGHLRRPLTGQQAVQVLRATAAPVTDPTLAWPGSPGEWNLQYGYGIPKLYAAMRAVSAESGAQVPPAVGITSPDWYVHLDPTRDRRVPVRARVDVPIGRSWNYELQLGLGPQPATFTTVAQGTRRGPSSGRLGTLDLSTVPRQFWAKPMTVSTAQDLPTAEQYALTLRLVVTPSGGATAVDRRAVYAQHDPDLVAGFPLRVGSSRDRYGFAPSGESQPALVDLAGTGRRALIAGNADGEVHAIDPLSGRDLPGWPVTTDRTQVRRHYPGVRAGHEPILANVAVGDLRGDGRPVVVATSLSGRVYAWTARGRRLPGWPRTLDTGVSRPAVPRPALPFTRRPVRGAVAAPVLVDLSGGRNAAGPLSVVQAGWDGHLHAFAPSGRERAGFPVKVTLPAGTTPKAGNVLVDDQKLDATPAVAYFDGPDHAPSLVVRSQYSETPGAGIKFGAFGYSFAYRPDGTLRPGWPARLPSLIEYYGSAQEFITEGSSSPVAADVTGTGTAPDQVAISPVWSVPQLLDGNGRTVGAFGVPLAELGTVTDPAKLVDLLARPVDLPIAFTTSGAFGRVGGELRYAQAASGASSLALALLNNNSGRGIQHLEATYPATGGPPSAGFEAAPRQGLDFLGSPMVTDLDGDGLGDVVDGGDSNAVHGYRASGGQAAGWPKFTSGWTVFSPSSGDLFGAGRTQVVTSTREGWVYAWNTRGSASGDQEWWRWQHDEHNSGNYGIHPPSRP
jgi:hypothetical protein